MYIIPVFRSVFSCKKGNRFTVGNFIAVTNRDKTSQFLTFESELKDMLWFKALSF